MIMKCSYKFAVANAPARVWHLRFDSHLRFLRPGLPFDLPSICRLRRPRAYAFPVRPILTRAHSIGRAHRCACTPGSAEREFASYCQTGASPKRPFSIQCSG
jgi:hypothetical protein